MASKVQPLRALMKGWTLNSYSGTQALTLKSDLKIPMMTCPNDVLIKVEASSVNPLDIAMSNGYGRALLTELGSRLSTVNISQDALILGRDFSGTIVDLGQGAQDKFKIGDQVWGAVFPSSQGSHAQYLVASSSSISLKPLNLSHVEAASIPYAGLTAWSAMMLSAGLTSHNTNNQFKTLVIGASGGVGTFAVQLLKAFNYKVVGVSQDPAFVTKLGADIALNYKEPDYDAQLRKLAGYDVIFDFAGVMNKATLDSYMRLLRPWSGSKCVTLTSPLLNSTDQDGIIMGSVKTVAGLASANLHYLTNGSSFRYGYFKPDPWALTSMSKLALKGKIKPVIQKVFPLEDLPNAYEQVSKGNLRGKIVIDHT